MMGTWFLGASILFAVIALWLLINEQVSVKRSLSSKVGKLQRQIDTINRNKHQGQSNKQQGESLGSLHPLRKEVSEQLSALQARLEAVEATVSQRSAATKVSHPTVEPKASKSAPAAAIARGESMRPPLRPVPEPPELSPLEIFIKALGTSLIKVDDFLRNAAVMEPTALNELSQLSNSGSLNSKFAALSWDNSTAGGKFEIIQMDEVQLLCFYRDAGAKQYFAVAPGLHQQRASMVSPIFGDTFVVNPKSAPVGAELKRVNAALIACFSPSDLTLNDLLSGIKREDTNDLLRLKALSSEELYQAGEIGV